MNLISSGLVCSVGLNAAAACAAIRAGVARYGELAYRDDRGEPIIGATVPTLAKEVKGPDRLVAMVSGAAVDCLHAVPLPAALPIPVLLCLAESARPGGGGGHAAQILAALQTAVGPRFHARLSRGISSGHTGPFEALQVAQQIVQDDATPYCLVCATDSYINAASLDWLEGHWRLKTPYNSDGIIPGEAGAALLVARSTVGRDSAAARMLGLGFARETASLLSGEPLLGKGLAEAARAALVEAKLEMHQIDFRLSDATGEQYGLKEQALLISRTMRQRRAAFPIWHCAEAIGDTGAAAGVIQLILATGAFRRGYAPGPRAIACASSIGGSRAVGVVAATGPTVTPDQRS